MKNSRIGLFSLKPIRNHQSTPNCTRLLVFALLAVLAPSSHAECEMYKMLDLPPINVPKLAMHGNTAAAFVPAQWRLVDKVESDFNGDKLADLALVIVGTDPRNIFKHDCPESPDLEDVDANPHGLIVALRQQGGYRRVAQDFVLIPRPQSMENDQPYDSLAVKKGVLHLVYNDNPSWRPRVDTRTYLFRFEKGCMRLIGLEGKYLEGPYITATVSTNFLTGKTISSSVSEHTPYSEQTHKLKSNPLYCLGNNKMPEAFKEEMGEDSFQ
ncbi:hypothetical protein [Methylovulum psychrotolerans]|uniref:Uncharacterized protein n=1 Tax=Methylovulum psychrotolerans TaxID=1704499 RepID=A0A2S5CNU8_9GAMM|nr:hypothetical protein [Methylovulum psychrotolerans]POZ52456.1 hypothetical protein AADEFJLK_01938 [Methylovulum psychrotolerans]